MKVRLILFLVVLAQQGCATNPTPLFEQIPLRQPSTESGKALIPSGVEGRTKDNAPRDSAVPTSLTRGTNLASLKEEVIEGLGSEPIEAKFRNQKRVGMTNLTVLT